MSRKKIIDFPEIGNMTTFSYYELLLSGKRATRFATKTSQNLPSSAVTPKNQPQKPLKKKSKKDNSSPHKKKKIDEVVPPSPPEEIIQLKYLYSCVWGEDCLDRKLWIDESGNFVSGKIEGFEEVHGEDMLPAKYKVNDTWYDLRKVKAYLVGETVEYQKSQWEVLYQFPAPLTYPQLDIRSLDGTMASVNISEISHPEYPEDFKNWIEAKQNIEVTDKDIHKFYFRFVTIKNNKQKILLLRKHEYTKKYFVYKDKQFRWINSEKYNFYCNTTEPPIPINILASFTPGPNLRKIYKKYFMQCEVSFPKAFQENKLFRKQTRCKICDFILDVLDYKQCENCQKCFHVQCLDPVACKSGFRNLWRCADCPRCENCLGVADKLLKCIDCNTHYHERCVDPNVLPTPGKIWRCDLCAQCMHCKIRPNEAGVKWNETITKCTTCDMKWKKKEYCSICEGFWFAKKGRQSRTEQRLCQNDDPEMIECDKCKMWVHLACEKSMTTDLWSQFTADKNMKYYCPKCNKEKNNAEIIEIVNQLMDLEKNKYFVKKIEEPSYNKAIKNPMFFEMMLENAREGLYYHNTQLLRDHFSLLCENAMHYLKANTDGYKAAQKLLDEGLSLLDCKFLPAKRRKPAISTVQKKPKQESDLENFNLDLPVSLDTPEFYEFSIDLLSSLPPVTFNPSLTIIINKSDIQPFMGPKPLLSFYPPPFSVAYSDQELCYVEQCYICASFIQNYEILTCRTCGRSFHDFCVNSSDLKSSLTWKCKDCRVCEICNSTQDALNILYCKKCEKGYDVQCLWPNVKGGLSLSEWICDRCFKCERCHTSTYHVPGFSPNREDFFSDFSMCFKCKWVVVHKDYCPECLKDWNSPYEIAETASERIPCKSCEFYFHPECVHDWKGVCNKCYENSVEYSQIEAGTLEKVQNFMNLKTQTSIYQFLVKQCLQNRYQIDPEIAKVLANLFLAENAEFMSASPDIKNFFASRGVEVSKKTSQKKSGYLNTRCAKVEGLRVSDMPSLRVPIVKMHRPKDPLYLWNIEWDTSSIILSLDKILTPLDNIEEVEIFYVPVLGENKIISVVSDFIFDFDLISEYMKLNSSAENIISQRFEWMQSGTKEISPIVDETLYDDKSDSYKIGDINQDAVLINEYSHEELLALYVKQEFPAAVSFIQKFETWLQEHLLDITQHIMNLNISEEPQESLVSPLEKIEKIDENIENDATLTLQCILCKEFGEKKISGRLIPCEENSWVHVNCAYWSSEVKVDDNGFMINFNLSVSRGKKTKCKECNKTGATLNCVAKKCRDSYHFPCALAGKIFFLENKGILCENCPPLREKTKSVSVEDLLLENYEKIVIFRSRKNVKKPSFVPGQFNRIGSLMLFEISPEKFVSYRLCWLNNQRRLVKCERKDKYYIVSEVSENFNTIIEICRAQELEELWPILKQGDSLILKSASDFFGFNISSNFSQSLQNPENFKTGKESKSILERISNLKASPFGSSRLAPYTKHKLVAKPPRGHINQKSAGYEENPEGKSETILVAEYRKYKKSIERDTNLEVFPSNIHGLGLYTTVDIPAGKIVVEYIGEIIRNKVADMREQEYELKGIGQGSCYLFRLDEDHVIDATVKGGKARFINHSCQPNSAASVCEIDGEKHILLFAKRSIHKGEEITYDYNFEVEEDKISCQCGSKDCQGKLN